jgi:hypothetical protein
MQKMPYNGGCQQRAAGGKSANHVLLMLSPLLTTSFSQCCENNAGNAYGENGIPLFIFINSAHFLMFKIDQHFTVHSSDQKEFRLV